MMSGIRRPTPDDVSAILDVAEANRVDYQRYQVTFWRRAGDSREQQLAFLQSHVVDERVIASVHESDRVIDGFVFASLLPARPVYSPGGPVALVDDIALRSPVDWLTLGAALVDEAIAEARRKGGARDRGGGPPR
jgi:hypothetical protein